MLWRFLNGCLIRKTSRKRPVLFCPQALEQRRLLSTVSWTGPSGGSWNTAADWSSGAVPGTGSDVVIAKSGTVQVNLSGNASVNSITITGDTLNVSGGTLAVAANSSIGAASTLSLNNATLSLASGTTLTNSGTITVSANSHLNDSGAIAQTVGGSLTLANATAGTGVGNNLVQNPGFESPAAGTSSTTDPDDWGTWGSTYVSTTYDHSGEQSLVQSGTNSGAYQSFGVTAGVSYTISVDALDPANSPLTGDQGGFLNLSFSNASGGTLSAGQQFVTLVSDTSTVGSWVNDTSTFTAPANAVTFNLYLQIGGYVYGQTGTQGGSVNWDDIAFGPTALNSATVTASSVSNSGTITVGGGDTITDSGTYSQTATGIFHSDLAGPSAGNDYGNLTAAGAATLAGTLDATLVNGYSPSINDGFTLISYSGETGSFGTYQLPSGSTYTFQVGVNPTYVGISAVPPALTAAINASVTTTTATDNLVGVNLAMWDSYLSTTQTQQMVEAAGLSILRFPGGSASDDYHFNVQDNGGYSSNTIPEFAEFVSQTNAIGIVTVDYGTGSPQEAEAELAYLEGSPSDTTVIGTGIQWSDTAEAWQNVNWQTVGYWASLRAASPLAKDDGYNFMRINHPAPFTNIKYWEMGNEEYGSWEDDEHGIAGPGGFSTGAQHDPATYATFTAAFEAFDAHDTQLPAVLTGIDSGSPDGSGDNNWTKNVVTYLYADGYIPGFISDHNYVQNAGSENDSFLLNSTVSSTTSIDGWATRHADYEAALVSIVGATKAASVQFLATEYNSNAGTEGKQMTSLVNGLFAADSIGSLLNAGYVGGLVWDLRNGWTTDGNNSPSLYGWREGGDEGILGAGYNDPPVTGPYIAYPTYFGEQLASKIMQTGGLDVSTLSSYAELAIYSVLEPNGDLDLMVLNKNPDSTLTQQFNLSGFTPSGAAELWQYGEAQDYAQSQSTTGASALANSIFNLSLNGNSFSYSFPAYSMSVLQLTPKLSLASAAAAVTSPGIVGTPITLSAAGLENGSDASLTYTWAATGPGSANFSGAVNGTHAAKSILADFSVAGTYTFTVSITDPGGQTVTSSVQDVILPLFASQSASTLNINLNSVAPINLTDSGAVTDLTEDGYVLAFTGITSVVVNGSATSNVLNVSGSLTAPFTFNTGATTQLNVQNGILNIAAGSGSTINPLLFSSVNILAGASLVLATPTSETGRTLLQTQTLTLAGNLGAWTARLDLGGNDLEVTGGNFANIQDQLKQGYNLAAGGNWQGSGGIVSSAAASDTTQLSTLGMILNTVDGSPTGAALYNSSNPFDGTAPPSTAILVKYTFDGDADLSGHVDGTDYSRIDNGFVQGLTGWFNGDFNYDGIVNGSDYTLIDNAFNRQTTNVTTEIATPASRIDSLWVDSSTPQQAVPNAVPITVLPTSASIYFSKGPSFNSSRLLWADQVLADCGLT
jgi:alpha-L-arabinofuranosidase